MDASFILTVLRETRRASAGVMGESMMQGQLAKITGHDFKETNNLPTARD